MSPTTAPPITLSSRDVQRLEALLESAQWRNHPAAQSLAGEMDRARVVEPEQMASDVVTMNSTVTCVEEVSGRQHTLTLSYPQDADSAAGRVSVLAPVGAALLGLSVGQAIDWSGPDGKPLRLRVAAIAYQPEAAGHYHL